MFIFVGTSLKFCHAGISLFLHHVLSHACFWGNKFLVGTTIILTDNVMVNFSTGKKFTQAEETQVACRQFGCCFFMLSRR